MIDLSITIASCDNVGQLHACLASIYETMPAGISVEVIAVDNASMASWAAIERDFPAVHIMRSNTSIGYASAHNMALSEATGRYLIIMNDDMVIHHNALEILIRYLDTHEDIGAVGCKLVYPNGTTQISSYLSFPTIKDALVEALLLNALLQRLPRRMKRPSVYGRPNTDDCIERPVRHLTGAFMAIRRAVIDTAGLLDAEYRFAFEDMDWCWRIRDAGWGIAYCPHAVVTHIGSQTLKKRGYRSLPAMYAGRLRFASLHGSALSTVALRFVLLLDISGKIIVAFLRYAISSGAARGNRLALVRAYCKSLALLPKRKAPAP